MSVFEVDQGGQASQAEYAADHVVSIEHVHPSIFETQKGIFVGLPSALVLFLVVLCITKRRVFGDSDIAKMAHGLFEFIGLLCFFTLIILMGAAAFLLFGEMVRAAGLGYSMERWAFALVAILSVASSALTAKGLYSIINR